MTFPREGLKVWDMAALWQRYTGLGFVFAMWMANDLHAEGARRIDFAAARDEGLASRPAIIDHYTTSLGLSSEIITRYLHENICFGIDEDLRRGLELYFLLAEKHGLDVCQMAIAFCLTKPFMTSVIIGATTMEQLKVNIAAADLQLSDAILNDIQQIFMLFPRTL